MATNTDILKDLKSFRGYVEAEFGNIRIDVQQNRDDILKMDEDIRGNGHPGLKAQQVANTLAISKTVSMMNKIEESFEAQRKQREADVRKIMWTLIGAALSILTGFGWFIVDLSQKIASQ